MIRFLIYFFNNFNKNVKIKLISNFKITRFCNSYRFSITIYRFFIYHYNKKTCPTYRIFLRFLLYYMFIRINVNRKLTRFFSKSLYILVLICNVDQNINRWNLFYIILIIKKIKFRNYISIFNCIDIISIFNLFTNLLLIKLNYSIFDYLQ